MTSDVVFYFEFESNENLVDQLFLSFCLYSFGLLYVQARFFASHGKMTMTMASLGNEPESLNLKA